MTIRTLRAYNEVHAGTLGVILRILAYVAILFGSGWVAATYFAGSHLAQVSFFCLGSAVFELILAGTSDSRRQAAYLLCLVLLVFAGGYLSQLMVTQAQSAPHSAVNP